MKIHYLEVVTTDVVSACAQYTRLLGLTFSEPDRNLGGARTLQMENGTLLGIRAPLHGGERPVVRPYVLVDDIAAAVAKAKEAGAVVAVSPMPIPGHGICAIYFLGGVEFGLWQI